MHRSGKLSIMTAVAALTSPCFAAAPPDQTPPPQGRSAPTAPTAPPAALALPKICLDVQSGDSVTNEFANRLRERIAASGTLSLALPTDTCSLQLHVPGNLLRFQTETGVMVSAVVILTSPSGRYLSASITACQANDLKPCAARAVAIAKLALLASSNDAA